MTMTMAAITPIKLTAREAVTFSEWFDRRFGRDDHHMLRNLISARSTIALARHADRICLRVNGADCEPWLVWMEGGALVAGEPWLATWLSERLSEPITYSPATG